MPKKHATDLQAFAAALNDYCLHNDIAFNMGAELSPQQLFPILDSYKAIQDFNRKTAGSSPTNELLFTFEVLLDYQSACPVINADVIHRNFIVIQSAIALLDKLKAG